MQVTVLKSKIHTATITESNLKYEGSITIDLNLMKKAGIYAYEKALVANISQGTRLETYVIAGKSDSGIIALNGAAARLGKVGDMVTIMTFAEKPAREAAKSNPRIITLNKQNKIKKNS